MCALLKSFIGHWRFAWVNLRGTGGILIPPSFLSRNDSEYARITKARTDYVIDFFGKYPWASLVDLALSLEGWDVGWLHRTLTCRDLMLSDTDANRKLTEIMWDWVKSGQGEKTDMPAIEIVIENNTHSVLLLNNNSFPIMKIKGLTAEQAVDTKRLAEDMYNMAKNEVLSHARIVYP